MKKLAAVGVLVVGSLAFAGQASAHNDGGAIVGALIGGAVLGAVVNSAINPPPVVAYQPAPVVYAAPAYAAPVYAPAPAPAPGYCYDGYRGAYVPCAPPPPPAPGYAQPGYGY